MECRLYGELTKPAVMLVGTWDPLIPNYFSLIEKANEYCEASGYELLLIMLDPMPADFLNNKQSPIYDCTSARVKLLNQQFTGAVCTVAMGPEDTAAGVHGFLPKISSQFGLAELWLRRGQTLGSGPQNSVRDINDLCRDLNIVFKILDTDATLAGTANIVRFNLQNGHVSLASELVGHSPLWERQLQANIPIGWKAGYYQYFPARYSAGNDVEVGKAGGVLEVFHNEDGHAVFNWPDNNIELITISEIISG